MREHQLDRLQPEYLEMLHPTSLEDYLEHIGQKISPRNLAGRGVTALFLETTQDDLTDKYVYGHGYVSNVEKSELAIRTVSFNFIDEHGNFSVYGTMNSNGLFTRQTDAGRERYGFITRPLPSFVKKTLLGTNNKPTLLA